MTVFQSDKLNDVLQNDFMHFTPLRYLECSIYSCLLSHCQEEEHGIIPEVVINISGGKIKMVCPQKYGMVLLEKAKECFIINNLKFPWVLEISDEEFENLKIRRIV